MCLPQAAITALIIYFNNNNELPPEIIKEAMQKGSS